MAGGDIIKIEYSHPIEGSGSFSCKSDEDGTINSGGFKSDDDSAMITGDGKPIYKLANTRWSFETPPVFWDMNGVDELETLNKMAASPVDADWVITSISGAVWAGKGRPVGELPGNTNTSQIPLKISGGGLLERIN